VSIDLDPGDLVESGSGLLWRVAWAFDNGQIRAIRCGANGEETSNRRGRVHWLRRTHVKVVRRQREAHDGPTR
jgi:hypothetical protein